jgi:hypothetical protein
VLLVQIVHRPRNGIIDEPLLQALRQASCDQNERARQQIDPVADGAGRSRYPLVGEQLDRNPGLDAALSDPERDQTSLLLYNMLKAGSLPPAEPGEYRVLG